MATITSISVHLWQEPFEAWINDIDSDACGLHIENGLTLFLPAKHRAKVETIAFLLNEIGRAEVKELEKAA